ncbi:GNAT family N-acetyltransferase [Halapricum desulfuricans]|uniref:Acetyltransferase, RimL family n=1 Tax=Halapricum desulfuricans TaxID=2841257 RepID=A0A897N745_9EURY|nr:GNAT family protein [Halapricum desulfuricans]QSG08271.1 Acetyltransferase, RimL family [Halapricum desulfuricans]
MPGPTFQSGERVSLRPVEEDDLDAFARARSDPDLRVPLCLDTQQNREALEEFHEETISGGDGRWFVVSADEATVGAVMFPDLREGDGVADLAYWILPEHQGEGFGREAVSLLLEYGFEELRLHRVRADCLATNDASRGLLESLGFSREGRFREAVFQNGTYVDTLRYGLLESEWRDR